MNYSIEAGIGNLEAIGSANATAGADPEAQAIRVFDAGSGHGSQRVSYRQSGEFIVERPACEA
jgi:hypothetical protein